MSIRTIEADGTRAPIVPLVQKAPEIPVLVERAATGDVDAFGELYAACLNPIYRYVLYHVRDTMEAEDVTEDVFFKAWKAIASCKGRGQTFIPWLYRIAHNHTMNVLRRENRNVSLEREVVIEVEGPEKEVAARLSRKRLFDAISCLPPNQRDVIILKFIEGLDNREIGKVINKKEGAIRVLQMRALSRLREQLGGMEPQDAV